MKKKNGETRMCVDYRTLDKYIIKDNYPLPLIDDQLDVMNNKAHFFRLDLKDGFHHISIAEESRKYTSFVTPIGQYDFLYMSFGLKTAPSRFQKLVNNVFKDLISSGDVVVYMDDILATTQTVEHHYPILRKVFKLLVKNKMELRLDKCEFLYSNIEFFVYKINKNGISPTVKGIEPF